MIDKTDLLMHTLITYSVQIYIDYLFIKQFINIQESFFLMKYWEKCELVEAFSLALM